MTGHEALKVIGRFLVDTVDYDRMTTKEIFELGRALGTIDQIIMQQTKEILLKADDNNESKKDSVKGDGLRHSLEIIDKAGRILGGE